MSAGPAPQQQQQQQQPQYRGPPPLGPFNKDRKFSEPERWICIYPAYLNSLKSLSGGRVMPKSLCVPNPTFQEIRDVLVSAGAGWTPIVENKLYPKEKSREIEFRGRIRVQLRNNDRTLFNEKYPDRESILKYLCEMIPQLKSRTSKQAPSQESQSSSSTVGAAKKGKKKK